MHTLFSSTRKDSYNCHETLNTFGTVQIRSAPFHVKLASGIYFSQLCVWKVQLGASPSPLYCAFLLSVGQVLFTAMQTHYFKCPWFQNLSEYYLCSFSFSLYLYPSFLKMNIENISINVVITLVLCWYNITSFYVYLLLPACFVIP